jgi:penicillin-binding protein 1A
MRDDEVLPPLASPAPNRPAGAPPPEASPTLPPISQADRRRARLAKAAIIAMPLLLLLWLAITAPLSKSLQPIAAPSITLVTADGEPIARRGANIMAPVTVADLPDHVPEAFLAIEDRRFYAHIGIDPWGIARAMWRNMIAGSVVEGGSTISQQLAKLSFLTSERTAGRKLQEALIALWLELWLPKEEILGRYLSNVYFGDNVYGLRAAAHHYFSREPEELTTAQAAMLAGLVKAPSRLAPTGNLKGARERAEVVIGAMVDAGMLTADEAEELRPARLKVAKSRDLPTGTYFADWVLPEARGRVLDLYGARVVETTLESDLQRLAQRAIRQAGLGSAQVALVAMHPDGRVVAMVGGKDYAKSPFNRVTQARRQPGSAFKLFVYIAALRAGMTPDTPISDTPLSIGTWSPNNYRNQYRGQIDLRQAFAVSSNVAAVRLSEQVGRAEVIRAARDLGVKSPLTEHPSLALGTSSITLLELTAAYAAVAGNRFPVTPHGLPPLEQNWLQRLWSNRSSFGWGRSSFDEATTWPMLLDLLSAAANEGTGRGAALQVRTFGKTGTTQNNRDAVFIGFAGDLVTGVWIGHDDNRPLPGVAGGGLPARIWRDFMAAALKSAPSLARPTMPPPEPVEIDPGAMFEEEGLGPFFPNEVPPGEDGEFDVQMMRPPEGPDDEVDAVVLPPEQAPPPPIDRRFEPEFEPKVEPEFEPVD